MPQENIVIIGQSPDVHIDRVIENLEALGASVFLFDQSRREHVVQLRAGGGGRGYLGDGDRRVDFESVHAVWWRWKPLSPAEWTGDFQSEGERFASGEWNHTLRSLPDFLPEARWVNSLDSHYRLQFKPRQMPLAQEVGFRVPETTFSNDPDSVLSLFGRHERLVYKTIKMYVVPPGEAIYTNEIALADIRESSESIRLAPGTFQELIEKEYELRVTIVGDRIFPARINSQSRETTKLDWRYDQLQDDMYAIAELDPALRDCLLEFHHRSGLLYGAYDLIVPKEGAPVFLEVNPGGQWLWLENALGLPIARALAELLVAPRP